MIIFLLLLPHSTFNDQYKLTHVTQTELEFSPLKNTPTTPRKPMHAVEHLTPSLDLWPTAYTPTDADMDPELFRYVPLMMILCGVILLQLIYILICMECV